MSQIHYFQRYSQRENVVTNNTLLLLARLYEESQSKFGRFWLQLLGVELPVGVNFTQQNATRLSTPDGLISQSSFNIVIETKIEGNFSPQQLINHLEAFRSKKADQQFLLAVGLYEPSTEVCNIVKQHIAENDLRVEFVTTTFEKIIAAFNEILLAYGDETLRYLIDDYREFCSDAKLLPDDDFLLRLVRTGRTKAENVEYGIYYNNKGFSSHKYIGLYWDKAIRAIGEIELVVRADINDGVIKPLSQDVKLTNEQQNRILKITTSAVKTNGWDISRDHTFFLVHKFHATEFRKTTPGPSWGSRFFDLRTVLDIKRVPSSTQEIASLLSGKTWL